MNGPDTLDCFNFGAIVRAQVDMMDAAGVRFERRDLLSRALRLFGINRTVPAREILK